MRLRADLTLLLVAAVWGSAFVAQRLAAQSFGIFTFNGLRFLLAAGLLLPFARGGWRQLNKNLIILFAGILLFTASALQQAGMKYTTAGNAGFLTGLYVIAVPLLVVLFKQVKKLLPAQQGRHEQLVAPGLAVWLAALLAAGGAYLLSGGMASIGPLSRLGDTLETLGALFWALHVILVGSAARAIDIFTFAGGQYLVCGLLNGAVGLALEPAALASAGPTAWAAIAYTGVLSVAIGYTLQVLAQRHAPPADAALILSMEAVFAAAAGWWWLGEAMSMQQLLGAVLILVALVFAQLTSPRRRESKGLSKQTT